MFMSLSIFPLSTAHNRATQMSQRWFEQPWTLEKVGILSLSDLHYGFLIPEDVRSRVFGVDR
jgi:hypothetical protein